MTRRTLSLVLIRHIILLPFQPTLSIALLQDLSTIKQKVAIMTAFHNWGCRKYMGLELWHGYVWHTFLQMLPRIEPSWAPGCKSKENVHFLYSKLWPVKSTILLLRRGSKVSKEIIVKPCRYRHEFSTPPKHWHDARSNFQECRFFALYLHRYQPITPLHRTDCQGKCALRIAAGIK